MLSHLCRVCGKFFPKTRDLTAHLKDVHLISDDSKKHYACTSCTFRTNNKIKLSQHIKQKHPDDSIERKKLEDYKKNNEQLECKICCRIMKFQNLKQHELQVHGLINGKKTDYTCEICGYFASSKETLVRHVETYHEPSNSINRIGSSSSLFKCSFCPKGFKHSGSLNKHLRDRHKTYEKPEPKKSCPLCSFLPNSNSAFEMVRHYKWDHEISIQNIKLQFTSVAEFFSWKLKEEAETCTKFSGRRIFNDRDCITYRCNRSGRPIPKGQTKKSRTNYNSIKINGFCPANIQAVREENGSVIVTYQKTHVGHGKDVKQEFLTETERITLANNLASKTPKNSVWSSIRSPLSTSDLLRIQTAAVEDLNNLKNCCDITSEAKILPFDPINVALWVNEVKSSVALRLLFYKEQNSHNDPFNFDDFILIFMFDSQMEMLKKYGENIICIDSTGNENPLNFQMYSLLVACDTYEGFPCAFMFSNRCDEHTFEFFFQKVKEQVGVVSSDVFMSSSEECYYQAWCSVMGVPKKRLLSSWCILEQWKSNIVKKVKTKPKRTQAYRTLEALLFASSKETFQSMMNKINMNWCSDSELQYFHTFFLTTYCNENLNLWAFYHRTDCRFNTRISMENFNHLLNHCNLKGKKAQSLDKTLCAVLKFIESKLFCMLLKMNQTKVIDKLRNLRTRHRESFQLNVSHVRTTSNQWYVLSPNETETYHIQKVMSCTQCSLPCSHCSSCLHEYICSCNENQFKFNMCKHIHLVCRLLINEKNKAVLQDTTIENDSFDDLDMDFITNTSVNTSPIPEILDNFVEEVIIEESPTCPNLENVTLEKLKQEFDSVVSKYVKTPTDLLFVKQLISSIEPSLNNLRKKSQPNDKIYSQKITKPFYLTQPFTSDDQSCISNSLSSVSINQHQSEENQNILCSLDSRQHQQQNSSAVKIVLGEKKKSVNELALASVKNKAHQLSHTPTIQKPISSSIIISKKKTPSLAGSVDSCLIKNNNFDSKKKFLVLQTKQICKIVNKESLTSKPKVFVIPMHQKNYRVQNQESPLDKRKPIVFKTKAEKRKIDFKMKPPQQNQFLVIQNEHAKTIVDDKVPSDTEPISAKKVKLPDKSKLLFLHLQPTNSEKNTQTQSVSGESSVIKSESLEKSEQFSSPIKIVLSSQQKPCESKSVINGEK